MNLLQTRSGRYGLFTLLYFCEGAPIGFVWYALPTLLRARDIGTDRIGGLVALLVLPWALKFLWAPLIDAWRGRRFGYRGWIASAQATMGLCLWPLLTLDPAEHFTAWAILLLLHAVAASTQDVAVDALAIRSTPRAEHGRINGCMQTGMLLGRGLFGGAGLWLALASGLEVLLTILIAAIWGSMLILLAVREGPEHSSRSTNDGPVGFRSFVAHLQRALHRRSMWWGLAFALTSAAAFEAAGVLAGPLLVDRNVHEDAIGLFFTLVPTLGPLAGVLVGGVLSDRLGHVRMVAWFLAGFVGMILGLSLTDHFMAVPPATLLMAWLAGMYVAIGLFTAASYAMYMDLTDPSLGGTQYSLFMSATNGCEAWSARVGGEWAQAHGYPTAFLLMCGVSLGSLPLLRWLAKDSPNPGPPPAGS